MVILALILLFDRFCTAATATSLGIPTHATPQRTENKPPLELPPDLSNYQLVSCVTGPPSIGLASAFATSAPAAPQPAAGTLVQNPPDGAESRQQLPRAPMDRIYLFVPPEEKAQVQSLGAQWDTASKR